MSIDSMLIAENINKINIHHFQNDVNYGSYPGGMDNFKLEGIHHVLKNPKWAYNWINIHDDFIVIHDGARYGQAPDSIIGIYIISFVEYLHKRCGGKVWYTGDNAWDQIDAWRLDHSYADLVYPPSPMTIEELYDYLINDIACCTCLRSTQKPIPETCKHCHAVKLVESLVSNRTV